MENLLKIYHDSLEEKTILHGWMDANGKLFCNKHKQNHYDSACDVMLNYYKTPQIYLKEDLYDFLFERNWLRIANQSNIIFCNNSKKQPTQNQIKELKNICIEYQKTEILYDNDLETRTLWLIEDKF
jgi:hypothetical protein